VAGALIGVLATTSGSELPRAARTDGDGCFRIDGLPFRSLRLNVLHERYRPLLLEGLSLEDGGTLDLHLVLDEGASISGVVVDDLGLPVENASILATNEVARTAVGDRNGCFAVSGLGDQRVSLLAFAPGYGKVLLRGLPPGATNVEIRLPLGATLSGALQADPLPRFFTVHLRDREAQQVRTEVFDGAAGGEFRMDDLTAGLYRVEVEAPGFDVLDVPEVAVPGGRASIRLRPRD
jgi:hypothetical protein